MAVSFSLVYFTCMKKSTTMVALPVAISSAATGLSQPRSTVATKAVTTVRQINIDRKSTRLNSSHSQISYAVFCLKKKKKQQNIHYIERVENASKTPQLLFTVPRREGVAEDTADQLCNNGRHTRYSAALDHRTT